jgi:hypothetical protein
MKKYKRSPKKELTYRLEMLDGFLQGRLADEVADSLSMDSLRKLIKKIEKKNKIIFLDDWQDYMFKTPSVMKNERNRRKGL